MSDPAVEAADRRAFSLLYGYGPRLRRDDLIAAAREALAPIRALHTRAGIQLMLDGQRYTICDHCEMPWPCATAELAYPSEEL